MGSNGLECVYTMLSEYSKTYPSKQETLAQCWFTVGVIVMDCYHMLFNPSSAGAAYIRVISFY